MSEISSSDQPSGIQCSVLDNEEKGRRKVEEVRTRDVFEEGITATASQPSIHPSSIRNTAVYTYSSSIRHSDAEGVMQQLFFSPGYLLPVLVLTVNCCSNAFTMMIVKSLHYNYR